jgi:hypothetical protein
MSNFRFNSVNCCDCGNKLIINQDDRAEYICVNCGVANKSQIDKLKASSNKAMKDFTKELHEAYRIARLTGQRRQHRLSEHAQRKIDLMRPNISSAEGEAVGSEHANHVMEIIENGHKLKAIFHFFSQLLC